MDRRQIAEDFIGQGYTASKVLGIVEIASSSFYYTPKLTKKGKKKSDSTKLNDGSFIPNEKVIEYIENILGTEFVDYGYRKVSHWLRKHKSCIINEKKVYRLMSENQLLNKRYKRSLTKRLWVKELVPKPKASFEYLEFDIKYIWIDGKQRYALLLTVIDVKSRWVLGYRLKWKIRKEDVIELFDNIFDRYSLPNKIYVRNDNGSQFEATMVQEYFKNKNVVQEFCKPATPEQNAHIESYHSIIQKVICSVYCFDDLFEAQQTFSRFVEFYNFKRIHSGINYGSPYEYLEQEGFPLNILKKIKSDILKKNCLIFQSDSRTSLQH